ncbi:MAG: EF2563 family selenium-dependent molybdenum hydroxylase system protein [Desulfobacterales bacterium]|nr:MAG: EF2563 family selenium-dependent molybdenum hydroxylase system protein [Desulfobacterales bacterium]
MARQAWGSRKREIGRRDSEGKRLKDKEKRIFKMAELRELIIAVKGAGEMGSAVAWRLFMANFRNIVMLEIDHPLAVRREVSFCEAVHDGQKQVEEVTALLVTNPAEVKKCWEKRNIAVMVDPRWLTISSLRPNVIIDAILAKRNLGTRKNDAELVVGLGPGFNAGEDVHMVVETNRGHHLGRIIMHGSAAPNTGVPGPIGGVTEQRVLRAPADGQFQPRLKIGDNVRQDQIVGSVAGNAVRSRIEGVLRGLIRPNIEVTQGLKIGDIDPRGDASYCYTISDKARAIAGSVLEAILRKYN